VVLLDLPKGGRRFLFLQEEGEGKKNTSGAAEEKRQKPGKKRCWVNDFKKDTEKETLKFRDITQAKRRGDKGDPLQKIYEPRGGREKGVLRRPLPKGPKGTTRISGWFKKGQEVKGD